ncbi:hypothetical protein [Hyalangium versicolor]|uniref:hypothetical protein n=1 Tax=Hyalangium versicolor TaxID=2861190 RepID=UPI001CC92C9F|nr:hypothetical protein [Hyalangium versicolor]
MGRLFPAFGADAAGRAALFVGESHDDNASLLALAWKTMWLAGRLDAIFIEYYPLGAGPTSPQVSDFSTTDAATLQGFTGHRKYSDLELERAAKKGHPKEIAEIDARGVKRFYSELAQLKYQCDRYHIRLEGWNVPSTTPQEKLMRSTPQWNERVFSALAGRLTTLGVRSYIVFGGKLHGALMQTCSLFTGGNLPCFHSDDARNLTEFDLQNKAHSVSELRKLGQIYADKPDTKTLFGFMYLRKLNVTFNNV